MTQVDTTTEAVERLAREHDLVRFTMGMKTHQHDDTAATLRQLAAERDALRARESDLLAALGRCFAVLVSQKFEPDAGHPPMVSDAAWQRAVDHARAAIAAAEKAHDDAEDIGDAIRALLAERDALRARVEEWRDEPPGGISKDGVLYLSPERVAAALATTHAAAWQAGAEWGRGACAADTDCGCKERDEVLRRNAINSTHAEMACPVGNMCQALQAAEIRALPLPPAPERGA